MSGGVKVEPLVSIITPSYNSEKYLDAFFISILEQDYQKYEMIFINDGSTDRTENIVYKYKEKFEERNIRFVYLKQENGGQAKAMNLGFPYIQGKYFIWPDSDDELYRNNISEKVKYMEQHPDIPLAMSGADYVDESGNVIKRLQRIKPEKDNFFEDLCTVLELKALSQRLQVAKMLSEHHVYNDIVAATGASTATISRVNRSLNYGCDGYSIVFERMNKGNDKND